MIYKIICKYAKDKIWQEKKQVLNLDRKKRDETKKYQLKEIKHNDLVNMKHEKMHTAFNYAVNLLILPSAVGDCVSISAFALLLGIHLGLTSSAV